MGVAYKTVFWSNTTIPPVLIMSTNKSTTIKHGKILVTELKDMNRTSQQVANTLLILSSSLFIVAAMATVVDVLMRSTVGWAVPNVIEFMTLTIGLGAILSIPICYWKDAHVTAKLLSEWNPKVFYKPLGIAGSTASLLFSLLLTWMMVSYALSQSNSPQTTAAMQLPMNILYFTVAAGCAGSAIGALIHFLTTLKKSYSHV